MGKGSQPSGNTTVTQQNPTQTAQLPFLQNLWGNTQNVANWADLGPDLQNLTSYLQGQETSTMTPGGALMPQAMGSLSSIIGAGVPSSAATAGLYGLAGGANYSPYLTPAMNTASNIYASMVPQLSNETGLAQFNLPSYANSAINSATDYGMTAGGLATSLANFTGDYTGPMTGYGNSVADLANPAISNATSQAGAINNTGAGMTNYGNLAAGMGQGQAGALNSLAGAVSNWGSGLSTNALTSMMGYGSNASTAANPNIAALMGLSGMAVSGNPIYDSLTGMSQGEFLNPSTNPALAGTISAATDPITRQYMTATAPQTDSQMELAGRYGSGAAGNAQSVNERNLGQALTNTTSSIVNNAYNTGLSSMLGAGTALGSAYNTGVGTAGNLQAAAAQAAQQGYSIGGALTNQGYTTAGNIGLGAYGADTSALTGAANAYNAGYGTAGNLYGGAGSLYGTAGSLLNTGYGTAGNLYGTAGNLYGNAGTLNTGALSAAMSGNINAGSLINSGYATGGNLISNAGQLYGNVAGLTDAAQQGALSGYLGAGNLYGGSLTQPGALYNYGGSLANSGLLSYGGLLQQAPSFAGYPAQVATSGVNAGFLPYQDYANVLGGAVGGSSTTTSPYFTNPTANLLGTGLGGLALMNGLGGSGILGSAGFGLGGGLGATEAGAAAANADLLAGGVGSSAAALGAGGSGILGGLSWLGAMI